ncbi:unnamed protein product [Closterium sp. NIES-54]
MASTATQSVVSGSLSRAPRSRSSSRGTTVNATLSAGRPLRLALRLSPLLPSCSPQLPALRRNSRRQSVSSVRSALTSSSPSDTLSASTSATDTIAVTKSTALNFPSTAAAVAAAWLLLLPSAPAAYALDGPSAPPSTVPAETTALEQPQRQQPPIMQVFRGMTAPEVADAPSSAEAEAEAEAEDGEWRYSRFLAEVDAGEVESVEFSTTGYSLVATTKGGDEHKVCVRASGPLIQLFRTISTSSLSLACTARTHFHPQSSIYPFPPRPPSYLPNSPSSSPRSSHSHCCAHRLRTSPPSPRPSPRARFFRASPHAGDDPDAQGVSTELVDTLARQGVETKIDAGLDPKVAFALELVFDTMLPPQPLPLLPPHPFPQLLPFPFLSPPPRPSHLLPNPPPPLPRTPVTQVMIPTLKGVSTELADTLASKGVETKIDAGLDPKVAFALELVFDTVLPLMIAFGLPFLLFNQANPFGPNGPFGSFLSGKGKFQEEPETTVRFDDVAGVDQAKLELQEMVDFLRNPSKYTDLGAKIPKGCLLAGPPGSGKTLLARAVAGEAGVPFFSIAASEFVEIFVGLGASRVRELFEKAKSKAPCIIFIDELDAVGRQRGGGMGGGNDEREQTINQLLTEMDGFQGNTGVIVLGATNRPDVLDAALTRPGRFDRQVVVDRPDVKGRVKILEVHSRGKRLDASVDLEKVARRTPGFTGADLQNLMNEAAIATARKDLPAITSVELSDALERITIGPERRAAVVSLEKQRLVAYHEAGHALVASLLSAFDDPVEKVTIVPRGGAGGLTFFAPSEERLESGLYSRAYLEAQLAVALGGRVAEEIIFGEERVTTGASNDLQKVTSTARRMVEQWGFSPAVGQVALVSSRGRNFLGGGGGAASEAECSQQTKLVVDGEVRRLVDTAYRKAKSALEENIGLLHRVVEVLLEKESINGEELQALILESKASLYI